MSGKNVCMLPLMKGILRIRKVYCLTQPIPVIMFKLLICCRVYIFVLYTLLDGFVRPEIIISGKHSNDTNPWFGIDGINNLLLQKKYNSTSTNLFNGFVETNLFSNQKTKKTDSLVHQGLSGLISRINSNNKSEQKKESLTKKLKDFKKYLWKWPVNNEKGTRGEQTEKPKWNLFPIEIGWKNKTDIEVNKSMTSKMNKTSKSVDDGGHQKSTPQAEKINEITNFGSQNNQTNEHAALNSECEQNVIKGFRECIERCKNYLKSVQVKNGGITPMNLSELNACIQNCRQDANSTACKLTTSSINIINEEIPIPKPTIRRNQNKYDKRHGFFYNFFIKPVLKSLLTLLFIVVGIVVVLYNFKDYRLYPRLADYITSTIESSYSEDEKRRAIFEGDCFPQQPKLNWKRTIIYFVRLNFLPRFFANNFTWLVPTRDHYQQAAENSNYIRIH